MEVAGTAWLDGVPLRGAELVLLRDRDESPVAVATTDSEGRFSFLEAGNDEGIVSGSYKVVVFKLADVPELDPRGSVTPPQVVPPLYSRSETTPLSIRIPLAREARLDLTTQ